MNIKPNVAAANENIYNHTELESIILNIGDIREQYNIYDELKIAKIWAAIGISQYECFSRSLPVMYKGITKNIIPQTTALK